MVRTGRTKAASETATETNSWSFFNKTATHHSHHRTTHADTTAADRIAETSSDTVLQLPLTSTDTSFTPRDTFT